LMTYRHMLKIKKIKPHIFINKNILCYEQKL